MAFQLIINQQTDTGFVTGITAAGATMDLGRANLCSQAGPHFMGVDASFGTMVKFAAAYDPALDGSNHAILEACQYAGYIQLAQLCFLGVPISPELLNGPLASYAPYAMETDGRDSFEFVDFMGPAQVALYLRPDRDPGQAPPPFFALNSTTSEQLSDISQLYTHPHQNGSLWRGPVERDNQALGATMRGSFTVAQIDEAQIREMLEDYKPLAEMAVTKEEVANSVVALLGLRAVAAQPGLDDDARSIGPQDITMARQIGQYSLLSVENFENEEPVLCVWVESDTVKVSLLPWEDMRQRERWNTDQFLGRVAAFFSDRNIVPGGVVVTPPPVARGRGAGGGLTANAFPWLDGPCLSLRLRSVVFGQQLRKTRRSRFGLMPISGFEWGLAWNLDSDTRDLTLGDIIPAQAIAEPGAVTSSRALAAYYAAQSNPALREATIDVTNFAQAELDTVDFERGRKRRFADR